MELTKKTTILFPDIFYRKLKKLASAKHVSTGELIRTACENQYGIALNTSSIKAVEELSNLALPVDTPHIMKMQSIPTAEKLMS